MYPIKYTKILFSFLNSLEKKFFYFIIFAQIFLSVLELFSIGSLVPVFAYFTNQNLQVSKVPFLDVNISLQILLYFVLFIFLVKNCLFILLQYISIKFRNKVTLRLVTSIYKSYLCKSYDFHMKNNSAILLRNVQEINSIDAIIMRITNFFSDLILFMVAIFFAILIKPLITLSILVILSLTLLVFYQTTVKNIRKYGVKDLDFNTLFLRNLLDGLHSFKEILLTGKQSYFINRNKFFKYEALKYKLKFNLVSIIPKPVLEILMVIVFIYMIQFSSINSQFNLTETLPILLAIIFAVIKIMPGVLRIFSNMQEFKFMEPQLKLIQSCMTSLNQDYYLNKDNKIFNDNLIFEDKIELSNISFEYSDKKIIDRINLLIKKNTTTAIIGSSGSGKTTLLNLITGLLKPSSGCFYVDDIESDLNNNQWLNKIGYVFQNTHLLDVTIKENIAFGHDAQNIDLKRVNECINLSELDVYVQSLKSGLDTVVGEKGARISGGQMQRIGLARALYNNPEILILDEATSSLDQENQTRILDTLLKLKKNITIILVSHNEHPLKIADKIYKIDDSKLIQVK